METTLAFLKFTGMLALSFGAMTTPWIGTAVLAAPMEADGWLA